MSNLKTEESDKMTAKLADLVSAAAAAAVKNDDDKGKVKESSTALAAAMYAAAWPIGFLDQSNGKSGQRSAWTALAGQGQSTLNKYVGVCRHIIVTLNGGKIPTAAQRKGVQRVAGTTWANNGTTNVKANVLDAAHVASLSDKSSGEFRKACQKERTSSEAVELVQPTITVTSIATLLAELVKDQHDVVTDELFGETVFAVIAAAATLLDLKVPLTV
mgnify:CR=1 FL=1